MEFRFIYDKENDILNIYDYSRKVSESVEFLEDVVLDLDLKGKVMGIEIFYASDFLSAFNKELNKNFLNNLECASMELKEFRNMWVILLCLKSANKVVYQSMPPLRKTEYISPLLNEVN